MGPKEDVAEEEEAPAGEALRGLPGRLLHDRVLGFFPRQRDGRQQVCRWQGGGTWKADPPVVMQLTQQTHEQRMHVIGYCDGGGKDQIKKISFRKTKKI